MDRHNLLQELREQLQVPIWGIATELEKALRDLSRVSHVNMADQRMIGSLLNNALSSAAETADLSRYGVEVAPVASGQSNKLFVNVECDGNLQRASLEVHLCGPRGGTSKQEHQFARCSVDIEREPHLPGFVIEAPTSILLFVSCHVIGTTIEAVFLKFADGEDRAQLQLHRPVPVVDIVPGVGAAVGEPAGAKLKIKRAKRDQTENGGTIDKRKDAASSSK